MKKGDLNNTKLRHATRRENHEAQKLSENMDAGKAICFHLSMVSKQEIDEKNK